MAAFKGKRKQNILNNTCRDNLGSFFLEGKSMWLSKVKVGEEVCHRFPVVRTRRAGVGRSTSWCETDEVRGSKKRGNNKMPLIRNLYPCLKAWGYCLPGDYPPISRTKRFF